MFRKTPRPGDEILPGAAQKTGTNALVCAPAPLQPGMVPVSPLQHIKKLARPVRASLL